MDRLIQALVLGLIGTAVFHLGFWHWIVTDPMNAIKSMPLWFWPIGIFMFIGPFCSGRE